MYNSLEEALAEFEAKPTRESAAAQVGVSAQTIVNYVRRGWLKEYRVRGHGPGAVTRIDQASIDALIAERQR